jgi:pimeloyl-ACP methyl ester carboxylesterase
MAGNVREWCWNPVADRRYILGGDWNDDGDMCMNPENLAPFDRSEGNGFRCIKPVGQIPEQALGARELSPVNRVGAPVSENVFQAYAGIFSYDRGQLDAATERAGESPHWRTEKISFRAAYGGERVTAYLFLPKNAKPPFQTVVYCPTLAAVYAHTSDQLEYPFMSFLMQSGRAVMYPIYKSTYERGTGAVWQGPSGERDVILHWRKDLSRSIDYLETRPDIDVNRLAFFGASLGSFWGPIFTQVDHRFKTSVLVAGGLSPNIPLPEVDSVNYLPRNHTPILLIAGRTDYICPVETHQKSVIRLSAAKPEDKRHVILNSGHSPSPFSEVIKEVVPWLDRYLGPVQTVVPR